MNKFNDILIAQIIETFMLHTESIEINKEASNKFFQLYKIEITSKQRLNTLSVIEFAKQGC